jgi:hypothetical protein
MPKNSPFDVNRKQNPANAKREEQDREIAAHGIGPPDKSRQHLHKLGYTR